LPLRTQALILSNPLFSLITTLERREAEDLEAEGRMELDEDDEDDEDIDAELNTSVTRSSQRGKPRTSILQQQESALKWAAENLNCKSSSSKSAIKV
jgi:hypothetical protein